MTALITPAQTTTLLAALLEDKKAVDICVMDVHDKTTVADTMIIATGTSTQHLRALANYVHEEAKKQGIHILGTEGAKNLEWVLVDLGAVIVHLMLPQTRQYYELEKIWQ